MDAKYYKKYLKYKIKYFNLLKGGVQAIEAEDDDDDDAFPEYLNYPPVPDTNNVEVKIKNFSEWPAWNENFSLSNWSNEDPNADEDIRDMIWNPDGTGKTVIINLTYQSPLEPWNRVFTINVNNTLKLKPIAFDDTNQVNQLVNSNFDPDGFLLNNKLNKFDPEPDDDRHGLNNQTNRPSWFYVDSDIDFIDPYYNNMHTPYCSNEIIRDFFQDYYNSDIYKEYLSFSQDLVGYDENDEPILEDNKLAPGILVKFKDMSDWEVNYSNIVEDDIVKEIGKIWDSDGVGLIVKIKKRKGIIEDDDADYLLKADGLGCFFSRYAFTDENQDEIAEFLSVPAETIVDSNNIVLESENQPAN